MLTEINHATRKFPLYPISFHNFSNGPLLIFSFISSLSFSRAGQSFTILDYHKVASNRHYELVNVLSALVL